MEGKLFDSELKVMEILWREGAALRLEGDFRCRPAVSREAVRQLETAQLIDRLYDGSADHLVASLLGGRKLSAEKLARLRELVDELEGGDAQ